MKTAKHGGCWRCKSMEQEVLKSVMVPGEIMSIAVCDNCKKEIESNGNTKK